MSNEPQVKTVKVPVYDTGLGREAGYENDAALIDAWNKRRASLPEAQRRMEDEFMARMARAFVLGSGGGGSKSSTSTP
jgi:hypothetical protein